MSDERGLVGRAAITLLILIVLGGLAAVDGGSVLFTKLQLTDVADAAASVGADSYQATHDLATAKQAAIAEAHSQDPHAKLQRFLVSRSGVVTVTVRKRASTMIVGRVGFLRHFGVVHATSSASP